MPVQHREGVERRETRPRADGRNRDAPDGFLAKLKESASAVDNVESIHHAASASLIEVDIVDLPDGFDALFSRHVNRMIDKDVARKRRAVDDPARAVRRPMASSSVSGGRSARMSWKMAVEGALQRFLLGLSHWWLLRAAVRMQGSRMSESFLARLAQSRRRKGVCKPNWERKKPRRGGHEGLSIAFSIVACS